MSSWRNGIVPFAMKGIGRDMQGVEFFIRHDDPGRIRPASYSACTVRPVVVALDVYEIVPHRWDEEHCVFREGQTTWQ